MPLVRYAHPRSEMNFVYRNRGIEGMAPSALTHPLVICPTIISQFPHNRRGIGTQLGIKRERIGLETEVSVSALEFKLVRITCRQIWNEDLPHPCARV